MTRKKSDPKKLGLLGGTFDPVHYGHLRIGEEIFNRFSLDRVEFLPAANPPHKIDRTFTCISHRLAMLRLAIAGNPSFSVSEVEAHRENLSYLVDTLEEYRDHYSPEVSIFFIIGMDSYQEISTWHRYPELFSLSHFIVTTRPGYKRPSLKTILSSEVARTFKSSENDQDAIEHVSGHKIYFQETTLLDISASMIRQKIRRSESVRYLLPDNVLDYINKHALYV